MAIAPQSAMPTLPPTTRPQPPSAVRAPLRPAGLSRHAVLSVVPEPRVGGVVARLVALVVATSFLVGFVAAVVLAFVTGTLTRLGH
jgi:hypothetical protein